MAEDDYNKENYKFLKIKRIASLIAGYIRGKLSQEEHDELDEWVGESDRNMYLFEMLTDIKNIRKALPFINRTESLKPFRKLIRDVETKRRSPGLAVTWYFTIAAILILTINISIFLISKHRINTRSQVRIIPEQFVVKSKDARKKAVLELSNGRFVILNRYENGYIGTQGIADIYKENGMVRYTSAENTLTENSPYNTLTTPRGGNFSIVLTNGTRIFLNAESSIRYPAKLRKDVNRIFVNGEAFIEMSKEVPGKLIFEIMGKGKVIAGQGARFSLIAYEDDAEIKVGSVKGKVEVFVNNRIENLEPFEGILVRNNKIEKLDSGETVALSKRRYGEFLFKSANLISISKFISRWYDLEVSCDTTLSNQRFDCRFSLEEDYYRIFSLFQNICGAEFIINGKRVRIVKPPFTKNSLKIDYKES